jgi:glycosyltransferase involved in cell wall biosynthesis
MNIVFEAPLNQVSFGNVAYNILKEFYKLQQTDSSIKLSYFPISNVDVSAFDKKDVDFQEWLKYSIENRYKNLSKDAISLKLWHINGAEKRLTRKQVLFSFYELDQPTPVEQSIVNLQDATIFSSSYAKNSFSAIGCENVFSAPLGFDGSFFKTNKKYLEGKTHFLLMGKFEKRKHTDKIIKLWAKKYGNNPKFQLSCSVMNPFLDKEIMKRMVIGYKNLASNINFLPYVSTNAEVNDIINSADIDLSGLSGAEGWGLPSFNATCLGKWSVVLNATSHKDWATSDNSILVEPSGKIEAYDGTFFNKGSSFNQGNIYDFSEEAVAAAFEKAVEFAKEKKQNDAGIALGQKFTYANTVSRIKEVLTQLS